MDKSWHKNYEQNYDERDGSRVRLDRGTESWDATPADDVDADDDDNGKRWRDSNIFLGTNTDNVHKSIEWKEVSSKEQKEEEMKGEIVLGKTINAFIDLAAAAAKEQLLLLCGQQTSLEVRPPLLLLLLLLLLLILLLKLSLAGMRGENNG